MQCSLRPAAGSVLEVPSEAFTTGEVSDLAFDFVKRRYFAMEVLDEVGARWMVGRLKAVRARAWMRVHCSGPHGEVDSEIGPVQPHRDGCFYFQALRFLSPGHYVLSFRLDCADGLSATKERAITVLARDDPESETPASDDATEDGAQPAVEALRQRKRARPMHLQGPASAAPGKRQRKGDPRPSALGEESRSRGRDWHLHEGLAGEYFASPSEPSLTIPPPSPPTHPPPSPAGETLTVFSRAELKREFAKRIGFAR